jgi:hypothetical protein
MSNRLRVVVSAIAFCVMTLPGFSRVNADGPYVETSDFVVTHDLFGHCGDFDIFADGSGTTRLSTFFDRDGNPIRVVFQGRYKGTLTNSVTGAYLLDSPSVANIMIDLVAGTQTNIGAFFTVTLPGQGKVLIDAGRIVFDGSGAPIFIAGPHRPPDAQIATICDALR